MTAAVTAVVTCICYLACAGTMTCVFWRLLQISESKLWALLSNGSLKIVFEKGAPCAKAVSGVLYCLGHCNPVREVCDISAMR